MTHPGLLERVVNSGQPSTRQMVALRSCRSQVCWLVLDAVPPVTSGQRVCRPKLRGFRGAELRRCFRPALRPIGVALFARAWYGYVERSFALNAKRAVDKCISALNPRERCRGVPQAVA
eukprot:37504-Chlamydomonas_euryale.AAC.13